MLMQYLPLILKAKKKVLKQSFKNKHLTMSTVSLNMKRVHRVGGRTRGSFRKVPENGIRCDLVNILLI